MSEYLYIDRGTCRKRNIFYWTVVSSFSLSLFLQLSLLHPSLMRVGGRIRTLSREALFQVTDHHPSSNSPIIWCHYQHRVVFFLLLLFFLFYEKDGWWECLFNPRSVRVSYLSHATGTPALLSYYFMMLFHLTAALKALFILKMCWKCAGSHKLVGFFSQLSMVSSSNSSIDEMVQ